MAENSKNPDPKNRPTIRRTPEEIAARQAPALAAKAAQQAHLARVGHVTRGSKPGGMREAVADPNYAQTSSENRQRRQREAAEAREQVGVQNPHRTASVQNMNAFAEGRDHKKLTIGANPNVEARRARFNKNK
jgi:hypothetical protein